MLVSTRQLPRPLWTLGSTCKPRGSQHAQSLILQLFYSSTSSSTSPHTSRSSAPRPDAESPIDDYYALLLSQPLPVQATSTRPTAAPAQSTNTPSSQPQQQSGPPPAEASDPAAKARVIFGSRLAGPAARAAREESYQQMKARGEGEWIAGTWIPPRPEEPDNCCMSGCVNCVWDGYREELEGWAGKRREARIRAGRMKQRARESAALSMDDDGGGSEGLWREGDVGLLREGDVGLLGKGEGEFGDQGLFEGIPVGIKEFMRTEKRLRERKRRRMGGGASVGR